eukprot:scaffold14023_cov124-Isochrysis_galbana.AAC.3
MAFQYAHIHTTQHTHTQREASPHSPDGVPSRGSDKRAAAHPWHATDATRPARRQTRLHRRDEARTRGRRHIEAGHKAEDTKHEAEGSEGM